jgi:hypothetical protein
MAATALKLLTKFGQQVTLTRYTGATIDPVTGEESSGSDVSTTVIGVLRPYPDKMIDGERIMAGDRELILSSSVEPLPADRFVIGGDAWGVVSIKDIVPAGTTIVYFVQVRR